MMMSGGAGEAAITYLLRADFTGADQGYANAQVLDTAAEGIVNGVGHVVEADGTLAIVSNKLAITAQTTPTWGDLGIWFEKSAGVGFTKTLGLAFSATINLSTWEEIGFGIHSAGSVVDPDAMLYSIQANTTDGQLDVKGGSAIYTGLSTGVDYRIVIACGGFNTDGESWYAGQIAANYLYGASYFLQIGADYHKIWMDKTDNTSEIYAVLSSLDAVGTVDLISAPDITNGTAFQPTGLSTFTAVNGTTLAAYTPEVGPAFTNVQTGDDQIQSNVITNQDAVAGHNVAGIADFGISNCVIDAIVTPTNDLAAIFMRFVSVTETWAVKLEAGTGNMILEERNAGTTIRATVAAGITANTAHHVTVYCYGQIITVFVDGANRISYTSAAFNESETKHGFQIDNVSGNTGSVNNFTVWPVTSSVYNTVFF